MFKICKKTLCVLLLVLIAGVSVGCLSIGGSRDDRRPEVKIGGDKGVVVDHPDND